LSAGFVLGSSACGPSIRMNHESSLYFERCHTAELLDGVSTADRAECWRRWLEWYAVGQEPALLMHARERIVYLSQGEAIEPLPSPAVADSGDEVPPPSEPPREGQGTVPVAPVYVPGVPTPREYRESTTCEPVCRPRWNVCASRCADDEGRRPCIGACQADYTNCMRGCF
jgi:hypothetical protein